MKRACNCSVLSNPTGEVHGNISGIFEQDFLLDYALDAGNLQEKVHTPVLCVWNYFLFSAIWKLTNMYRDGYEKGWPLFCPFKPHWWVHRNISGIFEQYFQLDYALDAGNLQEKVQPHTCPMCEKIFPYLCLLESDKYVPQWLWKRLAIVLSLQTKLVSAQQYFWHLWTIFYQIMR